MDRATHAAARRRDWTGGVASPADAEAADLAFWAKASPLERLTAVTELAEEWHRLRNPDGAPLRLDRTVGGIRRGGR